MAKSKSSKVFNQLRGYAWGNMYISPIQHGIQGWHANNEVFSKYRAGSDEMTLFTDWAKAHKTLILLNGGNSKALNAQYEKLCWLNDRLKKNKAAQDLMGVKSLPITVFFEPDLDNALMSVFTVLPDSMYCTSNDRAVVDEFFFKSPINRSTFMEDPEQGGMSPTASDACLKEAKRFFDKIGGGEANGRALQLAFKIVASNGRLA